MSAAERVYADRFRDEVRAKRPVIVDESKKRGIVDPHHVLPRQWLETHTSTLERAEAWSMIWNPDNGVPVDRGRHDDITASPWDRHRLQATELAPFPEVIAFAVEHDLVWLLGREVPTFDRGSLE